MKPKQQFALFAEMGTGKTYSALWWAEWLMENEAIDAILLVGLNGMYRNWKREIDKLSSKEWRVATYSAVMRKADREEVERVCKRFGTDEGKGHVLLMNVEGFSSAKAVQVARKFLTNNRALMIVDESTSIKGHKSKRTKALTDLGGLAARRLIMTGTPTPASPLDLYAPFRFLKPGLIQPEKQFLFEKKYTIKEKKHFGQRSFEVIVGYQNQEDLQEQIRPHSHRVLKKDCLDLPEKSYDRLDFELSSEMRGKYELMREELIAEIEGEDIIQATSLMAKMHKLQQMACGYVTDDEGNGHLIDDSRFNLAVDWVQSSGSQVILWCPYVFALRRLSEKLSGMTTVSPFWGEITEKQRAEGLEAWHRGDSQVFLGNPMSAGYGLTLTEANSMLFFANDPRLELRLQAEDRFHRIGQTEPTTVYDIVASGTRDERLVELLMSKHDVQSELMGDPKGEFLQFLKG